MVVTRFRSGALAAARRILNSTPSPDLNACVHPMLSDNASIAMKMNPMREVPFLLGATLDRLVRFTLLLGLVFHSASLGAAAMKLEPIGDWWDPARIELTGLKTFTPDQLRHALLGHAEYLVA